MVGADIPWRDNGSSQFAEGLKEDLQTDPPCHPKACAIQSCLTKNNYKEERCQKEVEALYQCCNAFYEQNGDDGKTVSCPKASLLRLKMRQMSQDATRK